MHRIEGRQRVVCLILSSGQHICTAIANPTNGHMRLMLQSLLFIYVRADSAQDRAWTMYPMPLTRLG